MLYRFIVFLVLIIFGSDASMSYSSINEQAEAILSGRVNEWLSKFCLGCDKSNMHFGDFMTISEDQVANYALQNGFKKDVVYDDSKSGPPLAETYYVIESRLSLWETYIQDRANQNDKKVFRTYEEAVRDVAGRLYLGSVIDLTAKYRDKHFPRLFPIPRPGQPWPDGKIRY
jgi:hypothetical protein